MSFGNTHGRHIPASSTSLNGCFSDDERATDSSLYCKSPNATIKRKPSMKPNIPLTWRTRQMKEMLERGEEGDSGVGGTLIARQRCTRADDTFKLHHTIDCAETDEYETNRQLGENSKSVTHERASTSSYIDYKTTSKYNTTHSLGGYSKIHDKVEGKGVIKDARDLQLPTNRPPSEDMQNNRFTLSLDLLPLPELSCEPIENICGSQPALSSPPTEAYAKLVYDIENQLTSLELKTSTSNDATRYCSYQPSLDSDNFGAFQISPHHSDESVYGTKVAYSASNFELQTENISILTPTTNKSEKNKDNTVSVEDVNFADVFKDVNLNMRDSPPTTLRNHRRV